MPYASVERQTLKVAAGIAATGVGGGKKAKGFTFIVGDREKLVSLDEDGPVYGHFAKAALDWSSEGYNISDVSGRCETSLCAACKEDGAIVIVDRATGQLLGGGYAVTEFGLSKANSDVSEGSAQAASSIAHLTKSFAFVATADNCATDGTPVGSYQLFNKDRRLIDDESIASWL